MKQASRALTPFRFASTQFLATVRPFSLAPRLISPPLARVAPQARLWMGTVSPYRLTQSRGTLARLCDGRRCSRAAGARLGLGADT